jgi:hypothetical protein
MANGNHLSRSWLVLLVSVGLIRLFTFRPDWVELYYSNGIYPVISSGFRALTGLLPFSLGDLVYLFLGCWLLADLIRLIRKVKKGTYNRATLVRNSLSYTRYILFIYLAFNLLWGLNYDRKGIASQLDLDLSDTGEANLKMVAGILANKVNTYRPAVPAQPFSRVREETEKAYATAGARYPFLLTRPHAMKSSLFGIFGNYFGYSGYYNPFTGEGHVNNEVPAFLVPFVTCHEMAHQAGYAKENEANFVGFLAGRESGDSAMLYSAYFNMFLYANGELRVRDSLAARRNVESLRPEVLADIQAYREHLMQYQGPVSELVDRIYTEYLKLNKQPAGLRSYSRVVIWLMAYYRKEGEL